MTDDKELIAMARLAQRDERMSTGALYGDLADRIEALIAERDRWKDACRSASRDLNIIVPDNDRLKSERDAAEAKLAKAVKALEYYAVEAMPWDADDSLQARATLAEIKGESHE
jgi:hypothetical protein